MKQPMDTSYPDDAGHVPAAMFTKFPVPIHELMKRRMSQTHSCRFSWRRE